MISALLLSAAVAASAQTAPAQNRRMPSFGRACAAHALSAEWDGVSFSLWLTDYTRPDSAPRTATLTFAGCSVMEEYLGEPMSPVEVRYYLSEGGDIAVIATADEGGAGATRLTLATRQGNNGFASSAQLGAYAHDKVFKQGVGVNAATIRDWRDDRTYTKNVFLIPIAKRPCDPYHEICE